MPSSKRLLQIANPSRSQYRILTRSRRRLLNTNRCPANASSSKCSRTRACSPSKLLRMSLAVKHRYSQETPFEEVEVAIPQLDRAWCAGMSSDNGKHQAPKGPTSTVCRLLGQVDSVYWDLELRVESLVVTAWESAVPTPSDDPFDMRRSSA